MSRLRHTALCALTAVLLASCSVPAALRSAASSSSPKEKQTTRGWWVLSGVADDLPPLVDTKGLNPLSMPDKKSPHYVNPFPQGSYEHFVAQKAYPVVSQVYSDERLLGYVTATNSKI